MKYLRHLHSSCVLYRLSYTISSILVDLSFPGSILYSLFHSLHGNASQPVMDSEERLPQQDFSVEAHRSQ